MRFEKNKRTKSCVFAVMRSVAGAVVQDACMTAVFATIARGQALNRKRADK